MLQDKETLRAHDDDYLRVGDTRDPDYKNAPLPPTEPLSSMRLGGLLLGPLLAVVVLMLPLPKA